MATFFDRGLHLKADDLLNEDVKIYSMRGYERISSCFEFEIKFLCNDDSELECADAVGSPATLTIEYANRTRTIRGIVGSVEFLGSLQSHRYAYAVTLVPRLALLGLSRQNQIHGTSEPETVLDVIEKQVLGTGLKGPAAPGPDRLSSDDCVWAVTAEYPARNLIVQHEESDLDFVSRLAEHYGISYFFEFQEAQTKVVFSDENTGFSTLTKESEDIPFEQHGSLGVSDEPRITRFGYRTTLAPRQVILKDHNYERPDLDLETPHDIAENGAGVVVEYGDHFLTKEEGAFLAKIRAEEIGCRKQVFTGHGDSPCFAAGHVFMLHDHPLKEINGKRFLIETVTHSAEVFVEDSDPDFDLPRASRYFNEFTALWRETPADQYRPKRVTPKPTIPGVISARIDAEGSGVRAELDEHGRYRVRQFKDLRDETDGKASNPIRKAESFGGKGYGVHFPLLKGAEVLLSFENGDPDRPIITGVVSNPHQPSQVKRPNQTMNRLLTPSGVTMETQDGSVSQAASRQGDSATDDRPSQLYTRIKVPGDGDDAAPRAYVRGGDHDARDTEAHTEISKKAHDGEELSPDMRKALDDTEKGDLEIEGIPEAGLYLATDKNVWQQVGEDHVTDIGGKRIAVVSGRSYEIIRGGESRTIRAADDDPPLASVIPDDLPLIGSDDPWSLLSFQQTFVDPLLGLPVSQSVSVGANLGINIGTNTLLTVGDVQRFSAGGNSGVKLGFSGDFNVSASQTVNAALTGKSSLVGESSLTMGAFYDYKNGPSCSISSGRKAKFRSSSWSEEAIAPPGMPIHILTGILFAIQQLCAAAALILGGIVIGAGVAVAIAANKDTDGDAGEKRKKTKAAALAGVATGLFGPKALSGLAVIMQCCATIAGITYMLEMRKAEGKAHADDPDAQKAAQDIKKASEDAKNASSGTNPATILIEASEQFAKELAKQSANISTPGIWVETKPKPSVQIGFKNGSYIYITPDGIQIRSLTTDIVSSLFRSWGNRQHAGPHHTLGPAQVDGPLNVSVAIVSPSIAGLSLTSPAGVSKAPVPLIVPLPPPIMPPDPKAPAS